MRSQSKAGRVFESRRRRFRPYNFTARAPDHGAEGIALLLRRHRGVKDTGGFFDSGKDVSLTSWRLVSSFGGGSWHPANLVCQNPQ